MVDSQPKKDVYAQRIQKRTSKEQNTLINHFVEAKNRQKMSKATGPPGSKQVSIMGKRVDLNSVAYNELHEMHDKLINLILTEEEGLINKHRNHVDKMCEFSTSVNKNKVRSMNYSKKLSNQDQI